MEVSIKTGHNAADKMHAASDGTIWTRARVHSSGCAATRVVP